MYHELSHIVAAVVVRGAHSKFALLELENVMRKSTRRDRMVVMQQLLVVDVKEKK